MGKKFYKVMVGISILLGSILVVENMVMGGSAQILIWYAKTGSLTIFSIIVGAVLGFGLKGLLTDSYNYGETDDFNY